MAYRRRGKGKKSKAWYDKQYSAMQLAKKAWQMAKYIKTLVNVERKFIDTSIAATLGNTGAVTRITDIAGGSAYNQRAGLSVKATSLFLRGSFICNNSIVGSLAQRARCVVFEDMDNTGTAPTTADVLESVAVNSPLNHTNGKRFKILYDRVFVLAPDASNAIQQFKHYIKLNDHVRWSDTTTGTREGQLYVIYFCDTGTATNQPAVDLQARIRFVDN